MLMQWDATSLMTCAKFQVSGRFVIDYMLEVTQILITSEIYQEAVEEGLRGRYPDAIEIKTRIDQGRIDSRSARRLQGVI